MPFTLIVVGVAVVVSWLRGGRLRRVGQADLAHAWLLFAGLGVQVVADILGPQGVVAPGVVYVLLLASQLGVLGWVALNWHRPGMVLVFVGFLMNAVVIGANGGMPVDPEAIRAIGLAGVHVDPGKHVAMAADTVLPWLGDRYPLAPIKTIISLGDMVLAAGLLPLVHHLMTFRTPVERRGGVRPDARAAPRPAPAADPQPALFASRDDAPQLVGPVGVDLDQDASRSR